MEPHAEDLPPAPSYLGLLTGNVQYRRVWLGEVVSYCGDWFSTIALYAIVQQLTDSTQAVAMVLIGKTLPIFLIMPFAGPLIDRFDRRKLLIGTDIARAVCVLGLIAAHRLESLPLLFTVLVVLVAFSGIFIPTRTAVIPQVTVEHEMPVAMALSGGTWSVMLAFGAALGGLFTGWIGIDGALVLDALTFLLSAAFLWRLPPLPPTDETAVPRTDTRFVDALQHLRGRVYLPAVLLCKAGLALAAGALVLLPIYGNGLYPSGGPTWIGLLYSARGLGALVGSMGMRRVLGDEPEVMQRAIVGGFLCTGVSLVLLSQAPTVGLAALGYFAAAIGNGLVWVFSGTLAQRATGANWRGRLFALEFGLMTLISSIASWSAGFADDQLGLSPRDIMAISGALMLLPAIAWSAVLLWAPDRPGSRSASA